MPKAIQILRSPTRKDMRASPRLANALRSLFRWERDSRKSVILGEPQHLDCQEHPRIKFSNDVPRDKDANLRQPEVLQRIATAVTTTPYDQPLHL